MTAAGHGPDVKVIAGGRTDDATVAAIAVALHRIALSGRTTSRRSAATPGWRRAALREGVGGRREVAPDGRG